MKSSKTSISSVSSIPSKKGFVLTALAALFLSCVYPVYDGDAELLTEQQSVWQYLKTFSIFHERLPDRCGNLAPEDMFRLISDSLRHNRFTEYIQTVPGGTGGGGGYDDIEVPPPEYIHKVTESMVYIEIPDFFEAGLELFQFFTDYLGRFDNIVIDLRGNGGGYLSAVNAMVGEFLPNGTEYIKTRHRVYDEDRREGRTVEEEARTSNTSPRLLNKNIAILVDKWSASASEIMVAALKDRANAYIVGSENTYGKGIGQYVITRGDRRILRITYLLISGVTGGKAGEYHRVGIAPDKLPDAIVDVADWMAGVMADEEYPRVPEGDPDPDKGRRDALRVWLRDYYSAIRILDPEYPAGGAPRLPAKMRPNLNKRSPVGLYNVVEESDLLK